jgi:hypothetical protein
MGVALVQFTELAARMEISDTARALAAIDDASVLIHAEVNNVWIESGELIDDVPLIARTVCFKVVERVLDNPDGLTSEAVGPFSQSRATASNDVYLTSNERRLVRRAAGLQSGIGSIELETPYARTVDSTLYAPQYGGGDDIPMIAL